MNGLYVAASGAASQIAGLDVAANNLANLDTPGFRRFLNVMRSVEGNGSPYQYAEADAVPPLDMAQGPLQATGNPLDIAIAGPAFLVVQAPDGYAYTRNGELQVAADGTLLAAGQPIVRDGGGIITLPAGNISIGGDGAINVNGAPVAKLALVDPSGLSMAPIGASLYRPANGETPPPTSGSQIHQGFVEHPAGTEVGEMVAMTNLARNYEAAMNAVHSIDQNQDQAIQAFTLQA